MWTYKARLATRTYDVDPAMLSEFFVFIGFITGLDEPAAKAIMHGGHKIRHPRAVFWAIPNDRKPLVLDSHQLT